MTKLPHELTADFPEFADRIHELKLSDGHFARLMDDYSDINARVHRAETLVEPIAPEAETELRKKRALLKDQIYAQLKDG